MYIYIINVYRMSVRCNVKYIYHNNINTTIIISEREMPPFTAPGETSS